MEPARPRGPKMNSDTGSGGVAKGDDLAILKVQQGAIREVDTPAEANAITTQKDEAADNDADRWRSDRNHQSNAARALKRDRLHNIDRAKNGGIKTDDCASVGRLGLSRVKGAACGARRSAIVRIVSSV